MKIKIRADSVEIEGYVNAVERASKPLMSRIGKFIERICAGAFKKALKRAEDVHILLNHDWTRDLGSIRKGNLELEEDAIGLHARARITDPEVIESAKRGDLVGWSFGFMDRDVENAMEDGLPLRKVRDLDLFEVSLLDKRMTPAYNGTLVATRSVNGEEEIQFRSEPLIAGEVDTTDETAENPDEAAERAAEILKDEGDQEDKDITIRNDGDDPNPKEPPVENSVETTAKVNYEVYKNIIKDMKEE